MAMHEEKDTLKQKCCSLSSVFSLLHSLFFFSLLSLLSVLSIWDRPFNCWWDPFPKKKRYGGQNWSAKLTPVGKIGANGQNWSAKLQPVGNNGRQNWGQRA
jgi:hypothetical protein